MANRLDFMREIYDIMEKGVFPEINQERSEQETFVDHMSLFEKGVWAWMVEAGKRLVILQKELGEKERNFFAIDDKVLADVVNLKATLEAMRSAFWECIEDHHHIDAQKYNVAIRKGYEIVTTPREEKKEEDRSQAPSGQDSLDVIIIRRKAENDPTAEDLIFAKPEGKPC